MNWKIKGRRAKKTADQGSKITPTTTIIPNKTTIIKIEIIITRQAIMALTKETKVISNKDIITTTTITTMEIITITGTYLLSNQIMCIKVQSRKSQIQLLMMTRISPL